MAKDKDIWILYRTENLINHKIYVGVHKLADTSKSRTYLGSGDSITAAIKKYGRKNFVRVTISEFSCVDDVYLAEAEMVTEEFIKRLGTYNISLGGRGGGIQTPEMREKISASKKGKKFSEEHKMKLSSYQNNRTEEHKAKIIAGRQGRITSQETKTKLSIANKGNNKAVSIPVVINEKYYISAKKASRIEGVGSTTTLRRIKDSRPQWSEWRYANEEEILNHLLK